MSKKRPAAGSLNVQVSPVFFWIPSRLAKADNIAYTDMNGPCTYSQVVQKAPVGGGGSSGRSSKHLEQAGGCFVRSNDLAPLW